LYAVLRENPLLRMAPKGIFQGISDETIQKMPEKGILQKGQTLFLRKIRSSQFSH
jgi:hypothetical protein